MLFVTHGAHARQRQREYGRMAHNTLWCRSTPIRNASVRRPSMPAHAARAIENGSYRNAREPEAQALQRVGMAQQIRVCCCQQEWRTQRRSRYAARGEMRWQPTGNGAAQCARYNTRTAYVISRYNAVSPTAEAHKRQTPRVSAYR